MVGNLRLPPLAKSEGVAGRRIPNTNTEFLACFAALLYIGDEDGSGQSWSTVHHRPVLLVRQLSVPTSPVPLL